MNKSHRIDCHPECDLGVNTDHPGYLGYRCIDAHGCTLPFPGEDHGGCLFPSPSPATSTDLDSTERNTP